jgi:hypothetical protein
MVNTQDSYHAEWVGGLMALLTIYKGTNTDTAGTKPMQCWTCKDRKTGVFTVDAYGKPMCPDCAKKAGRAVS